MERLSRALHAFGVHSLVILFLTLVVVVTGCSGSGSQLPVVPISFELPDGKSTARFSMEVAATNAERQVGLMYRKEIASDRGMIFLFPEQKVHRFWMKNTFIPLDMVFVSKDMKVVGILESVPPQTEDPRFVDEPSQYVLEFGAGVMRNSGVIVGSTVVVHAQLPGAL